MAALVVLAVVFAVYRDSTLLIGVGFGATVVIGTAAGQLLFVRRTPLPREPQPRFRISRRRELLLFGFAAPLLAAVGVAGLSAVGRFVSTSASLRIDFGALVGAIGAAFMAHFGLSFIAASRQSARPGERLENVARSHPK
jgi:hypothetical protein